MFMHFSTPWILEESKSTKPYILLTIISRYLSTFYCYIKFNVIYMLGEKCTKLCSNKEQWNNRHFHKLKNKKQNTTVLEKCWYKEQWRKKARKKKHIILCNLLDSFLKKRKLCLLRNFSIYITYFYFSTSKNSYFPLFLYRKSS